MNTTHLSGRTSYQCSGRVNWGRLLPWFLLLLIACAVLAALLEGLFLAGYYLVLLVPVLAALAITGLARLAVGRGHCRNPWIAGALGVLGGGAVYFGYYYAGMVHDLGPGAAGHVEWLPSYVRFRMATQVTRDIHDTRKDDQPRPRRGGDVVFNWLFFAAETGILLGLPAAGSYRRARKPYCETCQRWLSRELTQFEPAKAAELLDALQAGSARVLAALCAAPPFSTLPNTTVALDACPSLKDGTARDCPVFVSLKSVTANAGGGVALDPFETSKGKVLARALQLTPTELPAFAPRFPFLESFVGRSAVAALVPEPAPGASEGAPSGPAAEIRPVEPEYAGKVLTRKSAWIVNAFGLGAMLAVFAAVFVMAWGATIAFPSAPAPQPSPVAKTFGVGLLVLGGAIALAAVLLVLVNPSYFGNRYLRRLAKREFARRTGCLVSPNDPEALFVEVVPKLNWGKMMLENASDIGFLLLDRSRRQMLFEGDRERWRIPADALTHCEVEEFVVGQGTAGATRFFLVVLRAALPGQFWEAPVRERKATGIFLGRRRKKDAFKLCAAIKEALPSAFKPALGRT